MLDFIFNLPLLNEYGWRLLSGLRITAETVGLSVTLGFLLAIPLCQARMSRNKLLAWPALAYVTVFRGTPLLCQLYLVYYGAGEIRPALQSVGLWMVFREAFFCCIFTFSFNTAAYQAEIFRGALKSVSKGQAEAAAALGLSRWHAMRRVILPQAFLVALRPLGNELISMIKASALAAVVTLLDLMGQTRMVFSQTFDFSIYLYAALIYLAITEIIRRLWRLIERKASVHLAEAGVELPEIEVGRAPTQPALSPSAETPQTAPVVMPGLDPGTHAERANDVPAKTSANCRKCEQPTATPPRGCPGRARA